MSTFYATRSQFRIIPSLIVFMLCFALTFQGCGMGGGGSSPSPSPTANTSGLTYSKNGGNITQLSYSDPKTGLSSVFSFMVDSSGNSVYSSGTINSSEGNFSYVFDQTGALGKVVNQKTGEESRFNYFPDHVEVLGFSTQGVNTSVMVVYTVAGRIYVGSALPGNPYTLDSLSGKVDVTDAVNADLTKLTSLNSPTVKWFQSFELTPSAYALTNTEIIVLVVGVIGAVYMIGASATAILALARGAALSEPAVLKGIATIAALLILLRSALGSEIPAFNGTFVLTGSQHGLTCVYYTVWTYTGTLIPNMPSSFDVQSIATFTGNISGDPSDCAPIRQEAFTGGYSTQQNGNSVTSHYVDSTSASNFQGTISGNTLIGTASYSVHDYRDAKNPFDMDLTGAFTLSN